MSGKARIGIRHLLGLIAIVVVTLLGSTMPAGAVGAAPTTTTPAQTATPGVSDSIVRLYIAVFDRLPDAAGKSHWVAVYEGGMPLREIANAFMASDEWSQTYGAVDDDRFVDLLYANVLDRPADPDGLAYWRTTVQAVNRAEVLVSFSESDEFVVTTNTASPEAPTLAFPAIPANSGSGRRIVYANTDQQVWLINDDGTVHDSYEVSGRRATPGRGVYSVFSKSPKAYAGHDGITMNHMVRFARGRRLAIGFHSIPSYRSGRLMQTLDQLGTYQSAGCVRQSADKAEALFHWAPIGTTVVVLP